MTMMEAWKGSHFARILHVSTAPRGPYNPLWSHASKCTPSQIDPVLNPPKHAAYRFSLAFRCIVNTGEVNPSDVALCRPEHWTSLDAGAEAKGGRYTPPERRWRCRRWQCRSRGQCRDRIVSVEQNDDFALAPMKPNTMGCTILS